MLSDPTSGLVYQPTANGNAFAKTKGGTSFTTHPGGMFNPAALNIEADIVVFNCNSPQGNSHIKVWGVGLGMIGQASDLTGANILLRGGMKPGFPLATAQATQAGVLLQGTVYQGYGNWQGNDETLDLIFNPGALSTEQNISFNWVAGTPLSQALAVTLFQAFPGYKQKIAIANLVLNHTEPGQYFTIWQFGSYLTEITQKYGAALHGPNYAGVQITVTGNTVTAYDGTILPPVKMLAFNDLIGQPTWIGALTISFKTVLRSDLAPGSQIKFPPGIQAPYANTAPAAATPNTPASHKSTFQGNFIINEVHHFMNLRQSDGDSWCTAFTASPIIAAPAGT